MVKRETTLIKKAWGVEEVISNKSHCCKFLHVEPMQACSPHKHLKKTEDFYCLAGEGAVEISGEVEKLAAGGIIEVPTGAHHCLATAPGMTLLASSIRLATRAVARTNGTAPPL